MLIGCWKDTFMEQHEVNSSDIIKGNSDDVTDGLKTLRLQLS